MVRCGVGGDQDQGDAGGGARAEVGLHAARRQAATVALRVLVIPDAAGVAGAAAQQRHPEHRVGAGAARLAVDDVGVDPRHDPALLLPVEQEHGPLLEPHSPSTASPTSAWRSYNALHIPKTSKPIRSPFLPGRGAAISYIRQHPANAGSTRTDPGDSAARASRARNPDYPGLALSALWLPPVPPFQGEPDRPNDREPPAHPGIGRVPARSVGAGLRGDPILPTYQLAMPETLYLIDGHAQSSAPITPSAAGCAAP